MVVLALSLACAPLSLDPETAAGVVFSGDFGWIDTHSGDGVIALSAAPDADGVWRGTEWWEGATTSGWYVLEGELIDGVLVLDEVEVHPDHLDPGWSLCSGTFELRVDEETGALQTDYVGRSRNCDGMIGGGVFTDETPDSLIAALDAFTLD